MNQNDVLNTEQQEDFILQQDTSSVWVDEEEEIIPPSYSYVGDPNESYTYPEDIDRSDSYSTYSTTGPLDTFDNFDNVQGSTIVSLVIGVAGIIIVLFSLIALAR